MASPYVPVVNAAQFALNFADLNGDTQINEWWVQRSAPWTTAELVTMAAAFKTWYQVGDGTNKYQGGQSSHETLEAITYRDHTTQNGLTGVYQTGLPESGTAAVALVEPGLTKAFTARTGKAGRSYRGRTFYCGMGVNAIDNSEEGTLLAGWVAEQVAHFNALITAVPAADATCTLVVCSRFYQPGGSGTQTVARAAGVTTPITNYGYNNLFIDFQRRRAPGHGRHH